MPSWSSGSAKLTFCVYSCMVCASFRFDIPEKKRTLAFVK